MTEKIQKILDAYRQQYDDIAVYLLYGKAKNIQLNGLDLESSEYSDSQSIAVRAVKGGRVLSSGFSGVGAEAVEDFLKSGAQAIDSLPADPYRFIPQYQHIDGDLDVCDSSFDNISMNEMTDMAREVVGSAMQTDSRVKSVKQSAISASYKKKIIVSTSGPVMKKASTSFSATAYLIASENGEERDAYDFSASSKLTELNYVNCGIQAAESACSLLGAKHIETGKYSIMFSAQVMADFIELILELLDGDNVYKGLSLLKDKLGQKCASEKFSLTDDPTIIGGLGSALFDDEGQACEKLNLISSGVLNCFLHNSYSSKALGMKNTNRAAMSGTGSLAIGTSNIILESTTLDNSSSMKGDYLMITEVMGMHTADPVSGDFSIGVSGIRYINGERAYPFKEAALSGNLADLLDGTIEVFGNRKTHGNITTADTLFDKMTVSGV